MPAPLQVELTPEEDTTLRELSIATAVPRRTRQRAMVVRLNDDGWNVGHIAQHLQMHEQSAFAAQFGVGKVVGCVGYGTSVIRDGNGGGKNKMLKSLNAGCMKSAVTPVGNCVKS